MTLAPATPATTPRPRPVHYPESDGKPMAETDVHRNEMFALIGALRWRYRDAPDVYVSGNLLLYFEEGNPRRSVAPDVFVVKGVPPGDRRTFLLWAEGTPPCVVIEVSSRATRREDLRTKRALYARLGVREYFLFDPLEEYLRPPLQGYRLAGDDFAPIAPGSRGALDSVELGLTLVRDGSRLRLFDTGSGAEVMDDARRADDAEARALAAEAELARLRARLEG